jgi:hypothetical protein
MANIIVTSNPNFAEVVFNNMAGASGYEKANFNRSDIRQICKSSCGCFCFLEMRYGREWRLTITSAYNPDHPALIIDSIDGTTFSNVNELYTELKNLQLP